MKRLLFCLTLFSLLIAGTLWHASARMPVAIVGGGVPVAACNSITVDYWQKFDASDFLSSMPTGGWSKVDDSSRFSMDSSAKYTTRSCPGGVADSTDTYGLKYSGSGDEASVKYALGGNKTSVSIGFWFYTPAGFSTDSETDIGIFRSTNYDIIRITYIDISGVEGLRIHSAGSYSSVVTLSNSTWYWVTVKQIAGETDSMEIYNTSGAKVGDTVTCTDNNYEQVNAIWLGPSGYATAQTYFIYYDDLIIDFTDATFPLGP
jgi:hypothetical protein